MHSGFIHPHFKFKYDWLVSESSDGFTRFTGKNGSSERFDCFRRCLKEPQTVVESLNSPPPPTSWARFWKEKESIVLSER